MKLIKESLYEDIEDVENLEDTKQNIEDIEDIEDIESDELEQENSKYKFEIYGISDLGEEILDYANTPEEAQEIVDELRDSFGEEWEIGYRDATNLPIDEFNDDDEEDIFMTDYNEDNYYDSIEDFEDEKEYEIIPENLNETGKFSVETKEEQEEFINIFKQLGLEEEDINNLFNIKNNPNIKNSEKIKKLRAIFNMDVEKTKIQEYIGDNDDLNDFIQTFLFESEFNYL